MALIYLGLNMLKGIQIKLPVKFHGAVLWEILKQDQKHGSLWNLRKKPVWHGGWGNHNISMGWIEI